MKRYISYCTILFAILFATCTNSLEGLDPTEALNVSINKIELEATGGEQTVDILSYCDYKVESSENWKWITASATKGKKGNDKIKFILAENKTVENRTATIVIENSEYKLRHEITILQKGGNAFIIPSKDNIEATADGVKEVISVESNVNYAITSSQEWCKIDQIQGESGIKEITITIDSNLETEGRTATITLKNNEYNISKEIVINQFSFEPTLNVSDNSIETTDAGIIKDITITSNINWNATCGAEWIRLSRVNGKNGVTTLTVTVDKNANAEAREATIAISNNEYNITKEIAVSQLKFEPALNISENNIETSDAGVTKRITVTSNINWNATCEAEWITLSQVNGENGVTTLTVTVDKNANAEAREATIAILNNEYNITKEIAVSQLNFEPILNISDAYISTDCGGETKNLTVSSTINWITTCEAEWITLTPVNGTNGNTTLGVTIAGNEDTDARNANIIVSNEQYGITRTINVEQTGFVPYLSVVSGNSVNLDCLNGTKFLKINCNLDYEVSTDADWLSVEKVTDGINLIFTTNRDTSSSREAAITISSTEHEQIEVVVYVTQTNLSDNNVIRYTCTGGLFAPNGQTGFGANIIGLTIENGVGEIVFDAPITSISENAFSNCTQLTSITIPTSVTRIGSNAFKNCTALENIDIPSDVTSIEASAFAGCTSLENMTLPEYLSEIPEYLFDGCTSLKSVDMPSNITSIGSYAFNNCTELESIEIPESVIAIGSYAFKNCSAIESIEIPEGFTTIPEGMLYGCTSLKNVEIPSSISSIGANAFYDNSAIESIDLPSRLTSIGSYAFYNCSALTSIDLPLELASIGQYAFYNCSRINLVCIPSSVTSIGQYAFYYCSSLSIVICTGKTPASGGSNMFGYNANGRNIFVPVGSSSTYRSYSYWSNYSSSIYDIEYTPTECTSLSIVAEDVNANATSTIITYTAITNGTTPYGNVSNIEMTGRVQSKTFPQNTGEEDIVREISYTYMGQTATTTITQAAPIRKSYTVNLNNAWRASSVYNPNSSQYDGVYESYSNYNIHSSTATMYIDINGYDTFTIYVRSYGESNYDYVTVSYLDSSSIKTDTYGMSTSGTSISYYTKVTYSNIGGGSHRITVKYKKDGSGHSGYDRGYLLIPKNQ